MNFGEKCRIAVLSGAILLGLAVNGRMAEAMHVDGPAHHGCLAVS